MKLYETVMMGIFNGSYDDFWDNPANMDLGDLPMRLYNEGHRDCFYIDDWGQKLDVRDMTDQGGMRMYFDEDNGWIEI